VTASPFWDRGPRSLNRAARVPSIRAPVAVVAAVSTPLPSAATAKIEFLPSAFLKARNNPDSHKRAPDPKEAGWRTLDRRHRALRHWSPKMLGGTVSTRTFVEQMHSSGEGNGTCKQEGGDRGVGGGGLRLNAT
jgi:hypothetical protein